ncbi:hypothetical protein B0H14DRAFT_3015165 [Mycena olivaceomarginata]|nr:hypothetical protein B0H14DRAFT_3015165 [Mycena olivaceomarginata]
MSEPSFSPHQSLRVYTRNQRLVVLSVAEAGLTIGDETPYPTFDAPDFCLGAYLFSQKLTIKSDIRAPFGLTISTSNLSVPAPTGTEWCLDATGAEGKKDGTPDARHGKPGSALGLYIHDLEDAAALALSLRARGGQGGDTDSQDGVTGNGGQGGSIISVLQSTYFPLLEFAEKYRARAEFHPADTVKAITPEDSIYHGANKVLEMSKRVSPSQTTISNIFSRLSTSLAQIREGTKPPTALKVKLALVDGITEIENLIRDQLFQLAPNLDNYRGGYGGRGINVDVPGGKTGKIGREEQTFIGDLKTQSSVELRKQRLPFAHPEHCAMLLERADVFFYVNSPLMRSHAQRLYQHLIDRLSFLPLKHDDSLYRAYVESPIMPPSSLTDLARIRTSASMQLVALASGEVDYNGYAPQWVPRGSYKSYKQALDDALANLHLFEKAYTKYHVALVKQENLNDGARLAYNNTSLMVSSLDDDQKNLRLTLQDLDREIATMAPVVNEAQENLKDAYESVLDQIKVSFGLSISQLINAFTLITSSPMGNILSVADVIRPGFTSVPTIDGFPVTKEYLASEIRKSEASISHIAEILKDKLNEAYMLDDPFATRLSVAKEDILAELKKFSSEAFGGISIANVRKGLETKFDAFIDAVTKRNALILQYNMNVQLLKDSIEKAREYEKHKEELVSRQIQHNDPDLEKITAYMASIYQSSRARVMKLLNLLLRSLNFRMLQSYDVIEYIIPGGSHSAEAIDNVPLTLTAAVLASARGNIEKLFQQSVEHWKSEPAKFPANFDIDGGKRYYLNKSQRSRLLSDEHKVVVPIPIDTAGDFDGCCNIRIYRVRFVFIGLRTATKLERGESVFVRTTLVHSGNDTIMDRSGKTFSFDHDGVSTPYSFRLESDGSIKVIDDGNVGQADVNAVATSYAAPGPFAEWTVSLKWTLHANGIEKDWDGLDLSQVSEAYLDFCGTNYALWKSVPRA